MSEIVFYSLITILSAALFLGVTIYIKRTVEDFFKGVYLIAVNRLRIGDIVNINNIEGTIEKISLKNITIKDENNNCHYLRNCLIKKIENKSRNYTFCPIKVVVPKETDITEAVNNIKSAIKQVITETNFENSILDELEIYSIDKINNKEFCIEGKIKTSSYAKELIEKEIKNRIEKYYLNTISTQIN